MTTTTTCNGKSQEQIARELSSYFHPKDIQWKPDRFVSTSQGLRAVMLAYLDNRAIMQRLDDVCGPGNWKSKMERWGEAGALCTLSLLFNGTWVDRSDVSENSNVAALKGGASGAMKRAGSQWGIGRYLYDFPNAFLPATDQGGKKRLSKWGDRPQHPPEFLPGCEPWRSERAANARPQELAQIPPTQPAAQQAPAHAPRQEQQRPVEEYHPTQQPAQAQPDPTMQQQQTAEQRTIAQGVDPQGQPAWWEWEIKMSGDFKGKTWGHMADGSIDGRRMNWLQWYASLDPLKGDQRWHRGNQENQKRAFYIINLIKSKPGNQAETQVVEAEQGLQPQDNDFQNIDAAEQFGPDGDGLPF